MKGVEKMSCKIETKPVENCQEISLQILEPLLNGFKVTHIREIKINDNLKGLALSLKNKLGDIVRLYIEPNKENTSLIVSIHNPML